MEQRYFARPEAASVAIFGVFISGLEDVHFSDTEQGITKCLRTLRTHYVHPMYNVLVFARCSTLLVIIAAKMSLWTTWECDIFLS